LLFSQKSAKSLTSESWIDVIFAKGFKKMINKVFNKKRIKAALARVIAPYAYWSYEPVSPSEISDEKLIEAVLIYGNDPLRKHLLSLFSLNKIRSIWEKKLVIQDARMHELNRKIAAELLHIPNPEYHIQQAYRKYNLYDRFSA
jgi:hypothetical protein